MGLFSSKSASSLPQDILAAVHTMKDDLDGKAPTPQVVKASSVAASGSASPFVFAAAPALKNLEPVNENGLTSKITITGTDASNAIPDPKASSPFMQSDEAVASGATESPSPLALDVLPTPPTPPEKPPVTKLYSTLDPKLAPVTFAPDPPKKAPSFVSENVTLGSDDPVYVPEISVKQKSHVLMAGVILLVLALVAGGAFAYFTLVMKKPIASDPTSEPMKTDNSAADGKPSDILPVDTNMPFTLSSPNYLSIDVETVTAEQFRSLLATKEKLLEENKITDTAVEFFITDKNNTPVAFARFAKLLGMTFPQAVMDQIDESFSLYLYSDGKVARVGLSLSLKNKDLLSKAVTSGESALPFALQALYLDPSVTKIATPVWKSGTYKSYSTRYCNIAPTGLSNDYAFTDKHWIIGTSASAFRKILDTFGTAL